MLVAGGIALALGWLSKTLYVIGLNLMIIGSVAGAVAGFGALVMGESSRRWALAGAWIAVVFAAGVLQVVDDVHLQATFRYDLAGVEFADSGAGAFEDLDEGAIEFYAQGWEGLLAQQMTEKVGFDGPLARWLFRMDSGVRLFGPWKAGRGLDWGRAGGMIALLLQILLGLWLATRILNRTFQIADSEDLDQQREKTDATAS